MGCMVGVHSRGVRWGCPVQLVGMTGGDAIVPTSALCIQVSVAHWCLLTSGAQWFPLPDAVQSGCPVVPDANRWCPLATGVQCMLVSCGAHCLVVHAGALYMVVPSADNGARCPDACHHHPLVTSGSQCLLLPSGARCHPVSVPCAHQCPDVPRTHKIS